jgi:cytochrome c-type biogenesis protein CcmH/NrfF
VNGLLLWGLVLPILLVVAGTVVILRRRNSRR